MAGSLLHRQWLGARAALAVALLVLALWPLEAMAQDSVAFISSPQPGATVREVVLVTGTALHPRFSFYKVEFTREPGAAWVTIGETRPTQVRDGVLVQWDTRGVPDGSYSLRLLVVDETGNYLEEIVRQIAVANSSTTPTETPTITGTPAEALTATAQAGPTVTPMPAVPTATVVIEMPVLETTTPVVSAATAAPRATVSVSTPSEDDGTGGALVDMATGLLGEMLDAAGLGDMFRGVGSAVINGGLVAVGAFAVVGVLILFRQLFLVLYHLVLRR